MADFIKTNDYYEDENGPFRYKYARASLTADTVIFSVEGHQLYVLLIQRNENADTEAGKWAIPGGFLRVYPTPSEPRIDFTIDECGRRELQEETHFPEDITKNLDLRLVGVFSRANRDERGRVITVAYYNLARKCEVEGGDDAAIAKWWALNELPELAFDHQEIISAALKQLRADFQFDSAAFRLLDKTFTYRQLFDLYYAVYSDMFGDYQAFVESQRGNFINQIKKLDILDEISGKKEQDSSHPGISGKLYTFNEEKYRAIVEEKKKKMGTRCFNLINRD